MQADTDMICYHTPCDIDNRAKVLLDKQNNYNHMKIYHEMFYIMGDFDIKLYERNFD